MDTVDEDVVVGRDDPGEAKRFVDAGKVRQMDGQ
jgi:hypothetical protein